MTDRPADSPVQCAVAGGSLVGLSAAELRQSRYERYRHIGVYEEAGVTKS